MSRAMRIAIVNLTGGGLSGGYRTYLRELVPRLARHPEVAELSVALPPESGFTAHSLGTRCASWPKGARVVSWVRDFVRDHDADVVFIPTARWCDTGRPAAVMVRNMEPLLRPWEGNSIRDGLRNVLRRGAAREACRRAERVIAVSDFVRRFLTTRWEIAEDRIGVVRHGVAPAPDSATLRRPDALASGTESFLFTAGSIRPARGLDDLIGAMAELTDRPSLQLVVAGHVDPGAEGYGRRLRHGAESAGVAARITWAGTLSTSEMSWCFTHADCFVMTSRVEACPNTAMEAMVHGALSVATTLPPMPEFFAECATYYSAGNSHALALAIRAALAMPSTERERWRIAARQRAGCFGWDATADRTLRELRRTLGAGVEEAAVRVEPSAGPSASLLTN